MKLALNILDWVMPSAYQLERSYERSRNSRFYFWTVRRFIPKAFHMDDNKQLRSPKRWHLVRKIHESIQRWLDRWNRFFDVQRLKKTR